MTANTAEIIDISDNPIYESGAEVAPGIRRITSVDATPHLELLPPRGSSDTPFTAVDKDVHFTLGDAYDELRTLSRDNHDRVVSLRDVSSVTASTIKIGNQTHPMNNIAARALCSRYEIPYKYIRSIPHYLQSINLNHALIQHRDDEIFVRFNGDKVRGLFSTRYVPMDHVQIVKALMDAGVNPNKRVQLEVDYTLMRLSLVDAQRTFEVGHNDPHTPGISIVNSELGQSSFSIAPYVLRLVCTNGLITKVPGTATNFRHISDRALTRMPQILSMAYERVDDQQKQLHIATQRPVEQPEETLKTFARHFSLDKDQREAIAWALPYEISLDGTNTMFNIIQVLTKAAQCKDLTTEQNTHLQQVGGEVLRLVE
ncbi:MAG: DUF945 domain-containing protein [Candidatus Cloacimonetes bacterium]|nr:DUF945 domain-containing protein [Candidatus Cloacimonadota bacterium]MDY0173442.1 DUF932 domain-containing protein [Candidatus Cloacimonadaceae bacterium]